MFMKRPLRKLIAFSSAAAVLTNAATVTAFAGWKADPLSDTAFDQLIQYPDRNVYVRQAQTGTAAELIVIGKDGKKETVPLSDGISAVSLTTGQDRKFMGGTASVYGYNLDDPVFKLSAYDNGAVIARSQSGDKVQFMLIDSKTAKPLTDLFDAIEMMTPTLYKVQTTVINKYTYTKTDYDEEGNLKTEVSEVEEEKTAVGLINNAGKVVVKLGVDYESFSLTQDGQHLLIRTKDGSYFTDLTGKQIGEKYPQIQTVNSERIYQGWGDGWMVPSGSIDQDIFLFKNAEGKYAVGFSSVTPATAFFDKVEVGSTSVIYNRDIDYPERGKFQLLCYNNDASGARTLAAIYEPDGTAAESLAVQRQELELRDDEGNYPYTYTVSGGKVHICGRDLKEILTADSLERKTSNFFVVKNGGKYEMYNNQFKLIGSFDKMFTGFETPRGFSNAEYLFTKGSTAYLFDYRGNQIKGEFSAEILERMKKASEAKYLGSWSDVKGYIVKTGDAVWELWDTDLRVKQTFTLETKHGGTLGSEAGVFVFGDGLRVETDEKVTDENNVTVGYPETTYYEYNDKFDLMKTTDPGNAKGCGDYFCVRKDESSRWQLVDASGKAVLETTYPDFRVFTQERDGVEKQYYVGVFSSSFTVYDSELKQLCTVEGELESDVLYKNHNNGKQYGIYDLEKGAVTKAEYYSADRNDTLGYFRIDDCEGIGALDQRIYPLSKSGTVCYFDGTGKLRREIATTAAANYSFSGATYDAYTNSNIILNDTTNGGKTHRSYVYDAVADEIKYQQEGIYDRVSSYQDGYVVAVNEPDTQDQTLWTADDGIFQTLVRAEDGVELITPTKGLDIGSFVSQAGRNVISAKYSEEESSGLSVSLSSNRNSTSVYYYVTIKDLDPEFAKANGFAFAVKTDYDKYVVMKDNLLGIADTAGKLVSEMKYARIYNVYEGMALADILVPEEYEDYVWVKNPETNETEKETVIRQRYSIATTVLSFDGKELVTPRCSDTKAMWMTESDKVFGVAFVEYSGETTVYRVAFRQEDFANDFARTNGYELAVKYGKLYLVQKNGMKGVVTAENDVLVPLNYPDVLAYPQDEMALMTTPPDKRDVLSKEPFNSPFVALGDGSMLISFRTAEDKVAAFVIREEAAAVKGDLNGDGSVNLKDVVIMRRYIAGGWNVTIDETAADMNGDGEVNLKDVVLLRRQIAGGWDKK